jgi:hypothetical protein
MSVNKMDSNLKVDSPMIGVEGNGIHATQVSNQDTAVLLHYP